MALLSEHSLIAYFIANCDGSEHTASNCGCSLYFAALWEGKVTSAKVSFGLK